MRVGCPREARDTAIRMQTGAPEDWRAPLLRFPVHVEVDGRSMPATPSGRVVIAVLRDELH